MRTIKIYHPPGKAPPIPAFFDALNPKLRRKLKLQLLRLTQISMSDLKEPHFKHFSRLVFMLEQNQEVVVRKEKGKERSTFGCENLVHFSP